MSRADRRSERPSLGVTCFDCHVNGHTHNATHLVGDIRPQPFRHRIDTPSLRGVNIQRLFGSQRALETILAMEEAHADDLLSLLEEVGPQHP